MRKRSPCSFDTLQVKDDSKYSMAGFNAQPVAVEAPAPAAAAEFSPEAVDNKVFSKFSYGVEVLTTRVDGKDYGCIINTAGQVTSADPKKITISCIKKNHTCDMVMKAGKFNNLHPHRGRAPQPVPALRLPERPGRGQVCRPPL